MSSSNTDLVVRLRRLPQPGETLMGDDLAQSGGGKGANQAVAAARAGARVDFIGAFGDDAHGDERRQELAREGIELRHCFLKPRAASGAALIFVSDDGSNMIAVAPGTNGLLNPSDVAELPDALFHPGGWLVTQLETPLESVWSALTRAKLAGMSTILNPAPALSTVGNRDWLEKIDILVLNEMELDELVGMGTSACQDDRLDELHRRGAGAIVLTLGSVGHLLSEGIGRRNLTKARSVDALDTVAAGDTFVGALAARLIEGWSLSEAADWASASASLACTKHGALASIPMCRDVDDFLDRRQ